MKNMQDWKEKRLTMRHYDLQASIYKSHYIEEQTIKIEDVLKRIPILSKDFVLDLGCGTGFLFKHIAEKVEFIVGLDLSKKALKEAKKNTKTMTNIVLIRADSDNIPFQNCIFDKVFAISVLQNIPNPIKTITEIKRISKPQTRIALTGLKKKFTIESFIRLLESSHLKIETLSSNELMKGHAAICINRK